MLGAGNCNDLDLQWATRTFGEVHLVDLDAEALGRAVTRQKVEGLSNLHVHAPVDLLEIGRAEDAGAIGNGSFDVVLSPCVLSQLIEPVRKPLSGDLPRLMPLVEEIRVNHLRLMARLMAPGGCGVLGIDLVSSDVVAGLAQVQEGDLGDVLKRVIGNGRGFVGLDPPAMREAFIADTQLFRKIEGLTFTRPWLWHLGLLRSFLVYAICFRKRGLTPLHPDRGRR